MKCFNVKLVAVSLLLTAAASAGLATCDLSSTYPGEDDVVRNPVLEDRVHLRYAWFRASCLQHNPVFANQRWSCYPAIHTRYWKDRIKR